MIPRLLFLLAVIVPSPSPTPVPACAVPNREAQAVDAVQPDYPDSVADLKLKTTSALVAVSLDKDGKVLFTQISKSSGNETLDDAALSAAARSTYLPRIVDCNPVPSLVGVREVFDNTSGTPGPVTTPSITSAPKPSFSPPDGWFAAPAKELKGWQTFYRWIQRRSDITVIGTVDMDDTLDALRVYRRKELTGHGASIVTSKAVPICHGTQRGWLFVYTMHNGTAGYAEVVSLKDEAEYFAIYATFNPVRPSPGVIASLTSLCMP